MEHQTYSTDTAVHTDVWATFEETIANYSIAQTVEAITMFLHANYQYAKNVLNFIDTNNDRSLLCEGFYDNELAIHVFKEALIKKYRDVKSTQSLPLQFTRLVNEIKGCYFFSAQSVKKLNELLPD